MNPSDSKDIAQGYLKGFFNAVDALLDSSTTVEVSETKAPAKEELDKFPAEYPVALAARVASGPVLVLLPTQDVLKVFAATKEEATEPKQELEDGDLPALKEVFDPCLGEGAAFLKEKYDKEVPIEDTAVSQSGPESLGPFVEASGDAAIAAPFTFSAPPQLDGTGVFLFTETLEKLAHEAEKAEADDTGSSVPPQLSEKEAKEIVDSIHPDPEAKIAKAGGAAADNLDMVLGIQLVATARLGRVDMPISEILALGPGSIIEVGHLVDEPVELLVNEKLIARGDVVVVDEKFGLRITEIVSPEERIESLR